MLFQDSNASELRVTPDRVILECEDLYDADVKGLYGFMIHVLDRENDVITIVQGNTLDQQSCERRLKAVGKVLAEGKEIYIAGRGDLNKTDANSREEYLFQKRGPFRSRGRTLGFVAIANENGLCYDAYSGFQENACPPEPFPFWNGKSGQ